MTTGLLESISELRVLHGQIIRCRESAGDTADDAMAYVEELAGKTAGAIDRVDDAIRTLMGTVEDLRAEIAARRGGL